MNKHCLRILSSFALVIAAWGSDIPRPGLSYSFKTVTGEEVSLNKYRGNVIVVQFFSPECGHCQQNSQTLEKFYKELGPQGLTVLGVAFKAQEKAKDYISRFQITFPIGVDERESMCRYIQWPIEKPVNTPVLVLIDRKGTIREQHSGEETFTENEQAMKSAIESLLHENQGVPLRKQ